MKVLLCGGGTAGHVMPAIAIAEIIKKYFPKSEIAFAGRKGGAENKAYKSTGYLLYTIDISGFSRKLTINNIKSIFKLINSSRVAKKIIKDFKPDIIIGTGGYVCYPFIKEGLLKNINTVIHESNVYPGLVTRLLGPKCDALLLNLAGTKKYLKKADNTHTVGNPVRSSFNSLSKFEARKRLGISNDEFLIISFGGSLGAAKLNAEMLEFMHRFKRSDVRIKQIHSTGRSYYESIKKELPKISLNTGSEIVPYIDDMPIYLTAADLAITRSGAMTISELSNSKTPAILIPSPNVTANHQYANAKYMEELGAAVLIEEKDLCYDTLFTAVTKLISDRKRLSQMSQNTEKAVSKNTEKQIVKVIRGLRDIK